MDFPKQIIRNAYRSGSELAWRRQHIVEAVHAIAKSNCAILGGEVWLILKGDRIYGVLPRKDGFWGAYGWEVKRKDGETWGTFVSRSESESMAVITSGYPEDEELALPSESQLYYNLTWCAENEYPHDTR